MMSLYPEQLRRIADLCEVLNKVDDVPPQSPDLVLQQRIAVVDAMAPEDVYGYLVDEVGGAWSFEPKADD